MANKINPSKILKSKIVYQSKYFHVDQVDLEINGHKISKDIIRRNPSVFILAITPDDELYMVSQYRDALRTVSLEVIAGTADEKENLFEAAKRELKEETGLKAKKWVKLAILNFSANMTSYAHIFLAEELEQGKVKPDEDENISVVKIPFEEAKAKVLAGEITNSPSVSAILLLDNIRRKK